MSAEARSHGDGEGRLADSVGVSNSRCIKKAGRASAEHLLVVSNVSVAVMLVIVFAAR